MNHGSPEHSEDDENENDADAELPVDNDLVGELNENMAPRESYTDTSDNEDDQERQKRTKVFDTLTTKVPNAAKKRHR